MMQLSVLIGILVLQNEPQLVSGQGMFLGKYRTQIQNYIMTGHGGGWQDCDILSANTFPAEGTPQISLDLDKINELNIKSAFRLICSSAEALREWKSMTIQIEI